MKRLLILPWTLALIGCNAPAPEQANPPLVQNPADAIAQADVTAETSQSSGSSVSPTLTEVQRQQPTVPLGSREIVNPDDLQMVLMYYYAANAAPPIAEWVKNDYRYRSSSEFDRTQVQSQIEQEFGSSFESVQDTGFVVLTIESGLSEYSTTYQEYTLTGLGPRSRYSWYEQGQTVELSVENGVESQRWKLEPAKAEEVFQDSGRTVRLNVRFAIVGAVASGQNGRLLGRVKSVEVFSGNSDKRLDEFIVEP